jgi:phytoene synthase
MIRAATVHEREQRSDPVRSPLAGMPALRELASPDAYLARHSRSFRFAAALLRGTERDRVARVYAWCRFTDDLVDASSSGAVTTETRLDAWLAASRAAYDGRSCGIELVDRTMGEMAERYIPFTYAAELVAGVRSDLHFAPFRTLDALRVYTRRVAGVVGCWLAELHGVRDPWMIQRAAALGDAMQLTNILRDVGEDCEQGRIYLPLSVLHDHGLTSADVGAMKRGDRPIDAAYRDVVEELMDVASADYRAAREAIPFLPKSFRRAVAVAAAVYEGIQGALRRNGYDNIRLRAVTTTPRKIALAVGAILSSDWRGSRRHQKVPIRSSHPRFVA